MWAWRDTTDHTAPSKLKWTWGLSNRLSAKAAYPSTHTINLWNYRKTLTNWKSLASSCILKIQRLSRIPKFIVFSKQAIRRLSPCHCFCWCVNPNHHFYLRLILSSTSQPNGSTSLPLTWQARFIKSHLNKIPWSTVASQLLSVESGSTHIQLSETALEELMCRVLGDLLQAGFNNNKFLFFR